MSELFLLTMFAELSRTALRPVIWFAFGVGIIRGFLQRRDGRG
jgi:hypothetical protein